jgi:hypothetical protein
VLGLLVLAGAAAGCAQPQAQAPEPQVLTPEPPRKERDRCPSEAVEYDAPALRGSSAAELVAKFGSRRTARFEPTEQAAARRDRWPAEVTVAFTSTGEGVEVVRCPPTELNGKPIDQTALLIPVRVTLEFSGLPEVFLDTKLYAHSRYEVSIRGYTQLFGDKTAVQVRFDADDLDVSVGLLERKDLPKGLYWSSLCSADASAYVPEFFDSIPAPLVKEGVAMTTICDEEAGVFRASGSKPLRFLLTRVEPRGCRTFHRENAAAFEAEVSAVDAASSMPRPVRASLGIDRDMGRALLTFRTKLPPSEFVRSFHACPHPPAHASLAYQLNLRRGPTGVEVESEVFDLMYYCEDVIIRCKSEPTEPPPAP